MSRADDPRSLFEEALDWYQWAQYPRAVRLLEAALALTPGDAELHLWAGKGASRQRRSGGGPAGAPRGGASLPRGPRTASGPSRSVPLPR
jgi:hypothetical protein